jgi:GNAT superfamily N-acetyltransferase
MDFRIRDATDVDAPRIAELLVELGQPMGVDLIPERIAAVQREGGLVLVAEAVDAPLLGVMSVVRHHVIHAPGPIGYITALVTTSKVRRAGVGRALVAAAKAWAKSEGCVRLSVTSAEPRAEAHAFYPATGLPYTGRRYSVTIPEQAT